MYEKDEDRGKRRKRRAVKKSVQKSVMMRKNAGMDMAVLPIEAVVFYINPTITIIPPNINMIILPTQTRLCNVNQTTARFQRAIRSARANKDALIFN